MVRSKKKPTKTAKKVRNVTKEPLQEHARSPRGTGRKPVAAIMVPQEVKDMFECRKGAYSERFGKPVTAEQIMRRWMDGIGTAFDATTAKEARKRYRALLQERKEAEKATQATSEEAAPEGE